MHANSSSPLLNLSGKLALQFNRHIPSKYVPTSTQRNATSFESTYGKLIRCAGSILIS